MDNTIKQTVLTKLNELEKAHDIKILFAIESGSRGWGFESADSDYDCRFVYIHKKDWYLQVHEGRDVVELPVDEVLDIAGWDLKKALKLMYKTNMPLAEWLTTPVVYRKEKGVRERMLSLAETYFSPISAMHHYLNIARNSYESLNADEIRVKKLFYTLRPLLACIYIAKYMQVPPMNIDELIAALEIEQPILDDIDTLRAFKKNCTEADTTKIPTRVQQFIDREYQYYTEFVKHLKRDKAYDKSGLDSFFLEMLNGEGELE